MNLFYQPNLSEGFLQLDPTESLHAIRVLRYKEGDLINVTDGKGNLFHCEITSTSKACSFIIQSQQSIPIPSYHIHVALSPTKSSDRTEWFVEKATEIGIQKISFIQTKRSERNKLNIDRMNKVAIAAIKQSGQLWLPEIVSLGTLKEIVKAAADEKFIAHVSEQKIASLVHQAKPKKRYIVMIGPEGDFTNEEVDLALQDGFQSTNLGPTTLRTETAGLVACHILNIIQSQS